MIDRKIRTSPFNKNAILAEIRAKNHLHKRVKET